MTLDGWGDGRNQTVWAVKNDQLHFLVDSTENDIGRIYKMATLILGMRPDEQEFKVMGLAAYAKLSYVEKAKKILENISTVKGMREGMLTPCTVHGPAAAAGMSRRMKRSEPT